MKGSDSYPRNRDLGRALERMALVPLTMYTTTWCGYCKRLGAQLDRAGIAYELVDIERDEKAAEFVMGVNGGNQTVPTVVFPDGSAMTNPSLAEVKDRLAESA